MRCGFAGSGVSGSAKDPDGTSVEVAKQGKETRLDEFAAGTVNALRPVEVVGVYGVSTSRASIQEFAVYARFRRSR